MTKDDADVVEEVCEFGDGGETVDYVGWVFQAKNRRAQHSLGGRRADESNYRRHGHRWHGR